MACALVLAVILAFAALLPRARWQGDEYAVIGQVRDEGWPFVRDWAVRWSPRPVSDALYLGYAAGVDALRRPLAATCMAVLWLGLGCACVVPAWLTAEGRAPRVLAGLCLFALMLCGNPLTEVFYWPAGGLSYIPTLAAAVLLFWVLAAGRPRRAGAALALVLAAGSSEFGAFLALGVAACLGPVEARRHRRPPWWMAPGLAIAALDLALVLHGRVAGIERTGPTLHRAWPSVAAALPAFARELAAPEASEVELPPAMLSVLARVCVFLAARWTFRVIPAAGTRLLAFVAALLLAAYASLASAYYQFGGLCCERHNLVRACFVTLAIVAAGAWSAGKWPPGRRAAAPLAWVAAVLVLALPTAPAILADATSLPAALAARSRSWASGTRPGPDMVLVVDPAGRVVRSTRFAPGLSVAGQSTGWYQQAILRFFGKRRLLIVGGGR